MILYDALDRALARAAQDEAALLDARSQWAQLAGTVHDDSALYEERAAAFLEWYLTDYAPDGRPPAILGQLRTAEGEERATLAAIAAAHRSIFVVRELVPDGVVLDDLWGHASFRVHERRRLAGLEPGEVFESRLVADVEEPPRLCFARTFCFHPKEAMAEIEQQIERARASGEPRHVLLFRLLRRRVRCLHYQHIGAARIYGEARDS